MDPRKSKKADWDEENAFLAIDSNKLQHAVYFLLQEEICYNSRTHKEEPLGLQKLMIRHLSQISNYKVCAVDENMATLNVDAVIAKIQDAFYPVLSIPRNFERKKPAVIEQEAQEDDLIIDEEGDLL